MYPQTSAISVRVSATLTPENDNLVKNIAHWVFQYEHPYHWDLLSRQKVQQIEVQTFANAHSQN